MSTPDAPNTPANDNSGGTPGAATTAATTPSTTGPTPMETSPLVSSSNKQQQEQVPNDSSTTMTTDTVATPPNNPQTSKTSNKYKPEDQKVLEYLERQGMHEAARDLRQKLDNQQSETKKIVIDNNDNEGDFVVKDQEDGNDDNSKDDADQTSLWGVPDPNAAALAKAEPQRVEQVKTTLDAYCEMMDWVLQLPDVAANVTTATTATPNTNNSNQDSAEYDEAAALDNLPTANNNNNNSATTPTSVKPELMSVSFALLVYIYMDALEVGMESTAKKLRQAFAPFFRALYPDDSRDLDECTTTQDMQRLNTNSAQYRDSYNKLRAVADQLTKYHVRLEYNNSINNSNPQENRKLQMNTHLLLAEYQKRTVLSTQMLDKIQDLPLLQRAKSLRWILSLSNATYACLDEFLRHNSSTRLQSLWTVLQTKCTLQVQDREPNPHYTPTSPGFETAAAATATTSSTAGRELRLHETTPVHWGVPALQPEVDDSDEPIPFLEFNLQEEGYDTEKEAKRAQRLCNFNRSLLVHGFRRVEALERKREFYLSSPLAQKRARRGDDSDTPSAAALLANPWDASILLTTLSASSAPVSLVNDLNKNGEDSTSSTSWDIAGVPSVWEEPGVGICSARASYLGESVAAGCDDAAVRIYNQERGGGEPCQVLLGHKEGLPVFDVDWHRDGRSLLSVGGDGTIRLWDTMAVGPFGELTTPKDDPPPSTGKAGDKKKNQKGAAAAALQSSKVRKEKTEDLTATTTDMVVPGWRDSTEPVTYTSGAALAVYQTKHSDRPIWSVSFAPCGYYFCSAGADAAARLWTTDRPEPIRLFSGHTSGNVNCIEWHPNASYVVTGADDKTARMWDIHSGQTVRLLTGCSAGVNKVLISPGGRYCAGADYSGAVHLWDLGSGRKMSVLDPIEDESAPVSPFFVRDQTTIHSMAFSAGGDCLAVGSDDCTVRLWDIRTATTAGRNAKEIVQTRPVKTFPTRRTVVMDLQYTKRNLLLAVGKYTSPVIVNQH